jgi:hypothetical protein
MLASILLAAALPFAQPWSDTGLIIRDDDWSGVAGVVGYRGDGLTSVPGADPRSVLADGSGTPADVRANEADPGAVGLAAGVAEFELPDPVVALQGSATAAAPHLVLSLDTRGRSGVRVRYRLRDLDPSPIANAVQPVALQYRAGAAGEFASAPGGFVADATTGPGEAALVTPITATLPAAAEDKPLVQLRIITTNAIGQDEWVGVDDIEVQASGRVCGPPAEPPSGPPPASSPSPPSWPSPASGPSQAGPPDPARPRARPAAPAITGLALSPATFSAARRGPAVTRTGRTGTSLRFRLSGPAKVQFRVTSPRLPGTLAFAARSAGTRTAGVEWGRTPLVRREIGRFAVFGRGGLNRLRFSGRLRGRSLPAGQYRLTGRTIDRAGRASASATTGFRIR